MKGAKQQYDHDMASVFTERCFAQLQSTRFEKDTTLWANNVYVNTLYNNSEKMARIQERYEKAIGVRPL